MTDGDLRIQSDRVARTLGIKKSIARLELVINKRQKGKDKIQSLYIGGVLITSPRALNYMEFAELTLMQMELTYLHELLEEI